MSSFKGAVSATILALFSLTAFLAPVESAHSADRGAVFEDITVAFNHGKKRKGGRKGGKMGKRQAKAPYEYFEARGLFATGLVPVFPAGLDCPPISSPYGSKTRYDGSTRNNAHHNYHNGMDITVEPGTPLLAVADATIVHKGTAGQLVGSYVWLHMAPQATGLKMHVFARYQHLDEPSSRSVGEVVKAGDVVGLGGNTGTTGGHFGRAGYPHLHLVFSTGPDGTFTATEGVPLIQHSTQNYFDPVGLYLDRSFAAETNHALRDLPPEHKAVAVAVRTVDGRTIPEGAKMVWPLACR